MGQSSAVVDSTLFLACRHLLVCKITDDYAAEQQIWKTCPPQGIFTLQKSSYNGRPAQVEHMWDRVCDSAQCRLDMFFIENGSFLQKLSVFDKIIVNLALRAESRKKKMYTKIMM